MGFVTLKMSVTSTYARDNEQGERLRNRLDGFIWAKEIDEKIALIMIQENLQKSGLKAKPVSRFASSPIDRSESRVVIALHALFQSGMIVTLQNSNTKYSVWIS